MIFTAGDKEPTVAQTHTLQWADFLGGATITTSDVVAPPGITLVSEDYTADTVTLKTSGGEDGQDYRFLNSVTLSTGDTAEWTHLIRVTRNNIVPQGPPYATVREAVAYQPAAEGEEAMKVEMVLHDASDIVESIAPPPPEYKTQLTSPMDATQKTMAVEYPINLFSDPHKDTYDFPNSGVLLVDSEVIYYADKLTFTGLQFGGLMRGRLSSIPSTHTSGTEVREVSYAIRRRRAELYVFEWLWVTRAFIPSTAGVVGSASYDISDSVLRMVKRIMGLSSTSEGGVRGVVPMSSFRRRRRSPFDFQRG